MDIYASSEDSFQQDFFLQMDTSVAIIYGWCLSRGGKDTLYYRSKSKIERKYDGNMSINLKQYDVTRTKTTLTNLNQFSSDWNLAAGDVSRAHTGFISTNQPDSTIEFRAVKLVYAGRFDKFIFEKIE